MPNLAELMRAGTSMTCEAMVPTVTNINNASILTGDFPLKHGITGNYYFDRSNNSEVYMDSPEFLECDTLLARASKKGFRTLLLTVKDKLRRLLAKDVTCSFSVEKPLDWVVRKIGRPPHVYSSEASIWLFDAALRLLEEEFFDIVYISTTDYVPHKFRATDVEARQFMERIDEKIGLILKRDLALGVTSDHGMGEKRVKVDLERVLLEKGIKTRVLPIIKDEYVEHHLNLGGAVYLFLERVSEISRAQEILLNTEGVDAALNSREASKRHKLPCDRIGDLLVLGSEDVVFGSVERGLNEDVKLRSHGSLHEKYVPLIINKKIERIGELFNKDVFPILLAGFSF
jgi:phosphonoacetate hydrolase